MMNRSLLLLLLSLLIYGHEASANEVVSQVVSLDKSLIGNDLVFVSSGQVLKINSENGPLKDAIFLASISKKWMAFNINEKREILSATEVENPFPEDESSFKMFNVNTSFEPSILASQDHARKLFYEANLNKKESQCYNRAHIWAYDWRIKNNVYSSKVWIFFTRKYIREYEFEWWFHVAPFVHVVVDNSVKERVMDIKYARGPLKINQWSDIFMRNSAKCPVVEKYTDHADYPESAYCFLMKTSMYYYQPVDLEKLEQENVERSTWKYQEVKHAYKEAFDIDI